MSSTQVAQNSLDRGLVELETLVLNRPPNVLLAEYLSALAAEEVLAADAATRVSSAFNGVKYSALAADDAQVNEAAALLTQAAARLAAMSPEERQQIAQRVGERLQRPVAQPAQKLDTERSIDAPRTPVPAARADGAAWQNHSQAAVGESDESQFEFPDEHGLFVASLPQANGRRSALPRVPLELAALAALVTFFGGYFLRDAANKVAEASASPPPFPSAKRPLLDVFVATTSSLGNSEAQAKHYRKACLALELALAYSPEDATLLNNLAWYHLQPGESRTNPQRALELVNRALELSRQGIFLDTAAEAHFQLGDFREAVRLERDAIATCYEQDERVDRTFLDRQLQKFRDAEQTHTAAHAPLTGKSTSHP
jgi:tetratricopeptide (TPR) repeat protein